MVKIRLWGTPQEVAALAQHLRNDEGLQILSVSDSYPDRGESRYERVYIEADLKEPQQK